ncbi:MAG TPA: fimbria/pilus outer membrane usher protein [Gallionellaceae bacterium]
MGRILSLRPALLAMCLWPCAATVQAQPALPASAPAASAPAPATGEVVLNNVNRIMPLEVVINGAKTGTWLLLDRGGEMFAPADAFTEWRVQLPPNVKPIDFKLQGQPYYPLSAVPGYRFKLDIADQRAELLFSPEAFSATRLTQEAAKRPVVSPVLPSVFLNYDWNYLTTTQPNAPTTKDLGVITELGASGSMGVLTSSQVGRNLSNEAAATGTPRAWTRLETTYTRDFPDSNRTLRIGDTTTPAGMWGRNVYFGGIQYGTNFALTPGFTSQPLPVLAGTSTAPSTVEMYVNGVLRQVSKVPAGPFVIDSNPMMTGSGDVRMVVRDILGRDTVIEQSFFTSSQMLAAGLDDWSVQGGSLRRNMGMESNGYGPGFATAIWRHGYSNYVTLDGRVEATPQTRTAGMGTVFSMPWQMVGRASLAGSTGQSGGGNLWLLGLDHQSLHNGISFQLQRASINFRQLGQGINTLPVKQQLAGNWTHITESSGSYGMGLASFTQFDNTRVSTVSANYSVNVGQHSNLSFNANRAVYGTTGTSVAVFFYMPLDNGRIVDASASKQDSWVSASKNPSLDDGLGWRVLAGRRQAQPHEEGGVNYLGRYGQVAGDVSASPDMKAARVGAAGGLVLTDGSLFATPRMDQSFALVEVGDYDNIGVGLGNTVLTHTNDKGRALVPRLMAYQNNPVRLNPDDLPVSAEIENVEQFAVPSYRSGVKVAFPVRGGRGALLKIVLEDGQPAPAGATVHVEGDKEEFFVARRGEAYVTGLQANNNVLLDWNGQQCKFAVTLPPATKDDIPRVGPLLCKGVTR